MGLSTSKIVTFLKPKRRWFQFSLATLFLVTTALAVWLSMWTNRARKQQRAVEAIRQHGGSIAYSYEGPASRPPTPRGPQWLRDSLGIDYLDHVVRAKLVGDTFTDADLELLQSLPRLEYLMVDSANITDAGLAHLGSLHHVVVLNLSGDRITDAALANLQELPRLEYLTVDSANVTDAGLAHLGALHRLKSLSLRSEKITDAGLVRLQGLTELEFLRLECSITDAGTEHLRRLTKLRELRSLGSLDDKVKRQVVYALDSPTQLAFVDVPLLDVCEYLKDYHRMEVQIDDVALKDAKIDRLVKVTCTTKAGGLPLRTALDSLLEPLGLDWYIGQGTLVITTRDVVAKKHAGIERLQQALPNLKEVKIDW